MMDSYRPYGSNPELDRKIDSDNWMDRVDAGRENYGWDVLVNDKDPLVRECLARCGILVETFINDKEPKVVAAAVAGAVFNNINIDLTPVLSNEAKVVRETMALYGNAEESLLYVKDSDRDVRFNCAKNNVGLDALCEDEDIDLRNYVWQVLEDSYNNDIREWVKQHPDRTYDLERWSS